jgi:LPPG:FO 2-phospho-L-lactate transferase
MITVLAGGVGAARYLRGLCRVVDPTTVTAIVNTGDDTVMHGLNISPDLDTIVYTLAEAIDPERGWGLAGETWTALGALHRFAAVRPADSHAGETWFGLGDQDLATHMYRTARLAEGAPLHQVSDEIARAWELRLTVIPMTDATVSTIVDVVEEGELSFQEYFVGRRHGVPVRAVRFAGASSASPAPGVIDALHAADTIVIAPSNPIVSIGPLRAIEGIEQALVARRDLVIAISPIVAGVALKGPADRMLVELGHEASVVGVARLYAPICSTLVIDHADAHLAAAVEAQGMRCIVADTVMRSPEIAGQLAQITLDCVVNDATLDHVTTRGGTR